MGWSEFEVFRYEKLMQEFCAGHGPPPELGDKVWGYRIDPDRQSVQLFEVRPVLGDPKHKIESPIAKAVYVKSREIWKIYWMKRDKKWHIYEPEPHADSLGDVLEIIAGDKHCYFCG
ncbi:MAG: DUF3024 domain-containing protein [Desulfonatronovibrionaceae bacterium]